MRSFIIRKEIWCLRQFCFIPSCVIKMGHITGKSCYVVCWKRINWIAFNNNSKHCKGQRSIISNRGFIAFLKDRKNDYSFPYNRKYLFEETRLSINFSKGEDISEELFALELWTSPNPGDLVVRTSVKPL